MASADNKFMFHLRSVKYESNSNWWEQCKPKIHLEADDVERVHDLEVTIKHVDRQDIEVGEKISEIMNTYSAVNDSFISKKEISMRTKLSFYKYYIDIRMRNMGHDQAAEK